jgi:hypothetical protein
MTIRKLNSDDFKAIATRYMTEVVSRITTRDLQEWEQMAVGRHIQVDFKAYTKPRAWKRVSKRNHGIGIRREFTCDPVNSPGTMTVDEYLEGDQKKLKFKIGSDFPTPIQNAVKRLNEAGFSTEKLLDGLGINEMEDVAETVKTVSMKDTPKPDGYGAFA